MANLGPYLQGPAGVNILLRRLVWLILPDLPGRFASLDRCSSSSVLRCLGAGTSVAYLARQAIAQQIPRADNLTGHWNVALLLQLPVEGFHHSFERAGLGQFVPEEAKGVLVWCGAPKLKPRNRIQERRSRIMNSVRALDRLC